MSDPLPSPAEPPSGDAARERAPRSGRAGPGSREILAYAQSALGPASAAYLSTPTGLKGVQAQLESGRDLEDAVLGQIHATLGSGRGIHRKIGDEFAAHFMMEMMKSGSQTIPISSGLRRFLDTGDLVDSVFGDIWDDLAGLSFETRKQFLSLFLKRMGWKATDKARRIHSQARSENKRVPMPDEHELVAQDDEERRPPRLSMKQEERERLILILLRMKPRDARLLSLHLKGETIEAMADTLDLTYEATRKALSRAVEHARQLAGG